MERDYDIQRLADEELELLKKLSAVRAKMAKIEPRAKARSATTRPLREIVLDLVDAAGVPLNSLLIAQVLKPLLGRTVASTRFGALSADELSSFESGRPREVYLAHCLTADQGQAMKRFWARSDWPLHERLIGPMTGRVLFLKAAAWTIRLARDNDPAAVDGDVLKFVAADQARSAGAKVEHGTFAADRWLEFIDGQLAQYAAGDEAVRLEAAPRLKEHLTETELLFGARPPFLSVLGSTREWGGSASR